jgi:hypothetical protein
VPNYIQEGKKEKRGKAGPPRFECGFRVVLFEYGQTFRLCSEASILGLVGCLADSFQFSAAFIDLWMVRNRGLRFCWAFGLNSAKQREGKVCMNTLCVEIQIEFIRGEGEGEMI